jgi:hypothetical protein
VITSGASSARSAIAERRMRMGNEAVMAASMRPPNGDRLRADRSSKSALADAGSGLAASSANTYFTPSRVELSLAVTNMTVSDHFHRKCTNTRPKLSLSFSTR